MTYGSQYLLVPLALTFGVYSFGRAWLRLACLCLIVVWTAGIVITAAVRPEWRLMIWPVSHGIVWLLIHPWLKD